MFENLSIEQQRKYIIDKVKDPVRFTYPDKSVGVNGLVTGKLVHRTIVKDPLEHEEAGVIYWNIIDTIEFPERGRELWIRFTYYRYKYKAGTNADGKPRKLGWNFAGQTSFSDPISTVVDLIVNAMKEKPEFRTALLEGIKKLG